MPGHDIVVIGASAGGVEALSELVRHLPSGLPAALFVVMHFPAEAVSVLPRILERQGSLPVVHPRDGERIAHGHIYVAPPDHHLLVKRGTVRVVRGPKENRHRPAIDPLFRTAARAYAGRVIGVVLSGTLDDGTAGLSAIKQRGGMALVQDPEEATFAGMPRSAIEHVDIDAVLSLDALAAELVRLAHVPIHEEGVEPVSRELEEEADIAELDPHTLHDQQVPGSPSVYACPECHGVLWELRDGEMLRFRCRVGHAYSADALLADQEEALEEALWAALRALEESASLAQRLTERARERGHLLAAARFAEQQSGARQRAVLIRAVLLERTRQEPPTESSA